jgi:hypothetical protein
MVIASSRLRRKSGLVPSRASQIGLRAQTGQCHRIDLCRLRSTGQQKARKRQDRVLAKSSK